VLGADDKLRTRYLTFSSEVAPMLQELLMEYTLSEVVAPDADNMEFREHIQREVDRQTTYLMHCVSDFAAGVTTTVQEHARAVSDMSNELHHMIAQEIPCAADIASLCDYLQHRHDEQMHAPDTYHTGTVVPAEFAQLVRFFERNHIDVSMNTSEADTTSGHGHMSHEGPRVVLPWMTYVQQIQRGHWILRQMHELCQHAQRIQIRVQERFTTNTQLSTFCIRTQDAYVTAIGTLAERTGTCESAIVPTISVVVHFSVVCIFMECGMNSNIDSRRGMSPANRQALQLAFQAGMHVFHQTIQQHIHAPLEQCEHTSRLPIAQPDDFHEKADQIYQSAGAIVTFCEEECLNTQNITWRDILQRIVNFVEFRAWERHSPAPLSPGSDNGTHAGGVGRGGGGDEHGDGGGGSSGGRGGTGNSSSTYCSFTTEMVRCMRRNLVLEHIRGNQWTPIDVTM